MWTLTLNGKVNSFLTKGQLPQRRAQLLGAQCVSLRKVSGTVIASQKQNNRRTTGTESSI